jgi:GNAT superfamily N-acetyltransferase
VLRIVPATERDLPLILHFIQDLAEYERLREHAVVTLEDLRRWLFGSQKAAEVVIGYVDDEPAGFALYFQNFSTFLGKPGLYLEDLFVLPAWRGRGLGRKLLVHLARIAVDRGYGRMEWSVLDWNESAIRFYRSIGAVPMDDWTVYRLGGDALDRLADL